MGLAVANLVAKPHSVAAPYTAEGGSCPSFCSLQLVPNSPNVAGDSSHGSGNCRLDLDCRSAFGVSAILGGSFCWTRSDRLKYLLDRGDCVLAFRFHDTIAILLKDSFLRLDELFGQLFSLFFGLGYCSSSIMISA